MTTLAAEREKHQRWLSRRPAMQANFDALQANEFCSEDQLRVWQSQDLTRMIRFAAAQVPYYRNLLARLGLSAEDIRSPDDLPLLPPLQKSDVAARGPELRPRVLPAGERVAVMTHSSGTTGRPAAVPHTDQSNRMFSLLWHRQARWFDLDPAGTFLDVRIPSEVFRGTDSQSQAEGVLVQLPRWRYLGQFCDTGPEFRFSISNSSAQQVAWLRQIRPDYVMTYPGIFEEWLLAGEGRPPVDSLKCLIGIGTQLTPSLRQRLEQAYDIPIHQTYGLNEIGKVALRCEAGRYHAHAEHCLVEIVTPDGRPCAAGQTGKVLVTGLRNLAMPLIRYDTGDLAEAVSGPCSCGRTLPSFGEIAGRFRRYAGLPAGTRERVNALLKAFDQAPPGLLSFLRRYQIHQHRDHRFTLRVQTTGPIPAAFCEHMRRAWATVPETASTPLAILEVPQIFPSPSGKLLDFSSELYTDTYATPAKED